ncbi:hypothetical protein F5X99DRAFT_426748 [Biscogniauxia marginata]|nr:hypothetical protein F5X99DRAFT_426748 [Biscogniauxia marginata]
MPMTWNEKSERDLMAAMLMTASGSDLGKFKPSWGAVVAKMAIMGYDTNASSISEHLQVTPTSLKILLTFPVFPLISQRWSKVMVRDLKKHHPNLFDESAQSPSPAKPEATAAAAAAAAALTTPNGKKRGRGRPPKVPKNDVNNQDLVDEADDGDVDSENDRKPAKMAKLEPEPQNDDNDGLV